MSKQNPKDPQANQNAKTADTEPAANPELLAALAQLAGVLTESVVPPAKTDESSSEKPVR